jgi:hypothetical protein
MDVGSVQFELSCNASANKPDRAQRTVPRSADSWHAQPKAHLHAVPAEGRARIIYDVGIGHGDVALYAGVGQPNGTFPARSFDRCPIHLEIAGES